jgi:hypothetical protein
MARLATILCGLFAVLTMAIPDARAEKRVALVVGNGAYQNASSLPNPANDANAIADLFRKAGFDVVEAKLDLGNLEFKRVAREFSVAARDADIAVVYFAGHGIEVNGTNYLLPVDAKLASDFDVEDEALSLDRIMRAIEPAKRLRLIILDACRDNPFARTMKRGLSARSVASGLAKVEPATTDTLIAFATRPGATADDGRNANSPFTAALVKNLTVPGRDIRIALGHVRDEVMRETGNRQEPFVSGSLGGATVTLIPDKQVASAPEKPAEPTRQIQVLPNPQDAGSVPDPRRDYEFAERVGTLDAWDSFLAVHPSGFYATLARSQRDRLAPRAEPNATPAVTASPAQPQIALLSPPNVQQQEPRLDPLAIARELQTELKRVGCDPGTVDGNWTPQTRQAIGRFNLRAGMNLDTRGATVTALESVRVQRGRICPLVCRAGQRAEGESCVAIPAAPAKQQASRPAERPRKAEPPRAPKQAVRERPIRAPTDREIFGGGRPPAAAPPLSIGVGRGGLGVGFSF